MRLLQLMAGAASGGAEKFFERLAIALHEADVEQRLLLRPDTGREARLRAAGLAVRTAPFGGALDLSTRRRIRAQVSEFQPTVVLTWMNRASRHCPPLPMPVVARLGGYYDLKYYKNAQYLIGNTPDLVRYFRTQGWPAPYTHYLPNFADDVPVFAATKTREPGRVRLLAMGRFHPNKGFDTLLEALALLQPHYHLTLAGEGPEAAALQQRLQRLGLKGRVTLPGWQEDTAPLWQKADIFVCPSRHEPLGNVMLEALAWGMPQVATNTDGARLLLTHEHTALITPVGDAGAFAAAIQHLGDNPPLAAAYGAQAATLYQTTYAKTAVVAQYIRFLEEIPPS